MNLDFIDTISTEVLEEMLIDISSDYSSRDFFFESLDEFLSYELLTEAVNPVERRRAQKLRDAAIKAAAKKNTRLKARFERKKSNEAINKGIKGKWDRRPWYKKAFSKLKKWVKKGLESKNKESDSESDQEVVYVTRRAAPSRTQRVVSSSETTRQPSSERRSTPSNQPEQPKPKSDLQKRAEEIRSQRKATEAKKKLSFKAFRKKSQEAKFKAMPKPKAPSELLKPKENPEPGHPDASGSSAPPASVRRGHPASPEAVRRRPNPPAAATMRPRQ